MSTVPLFSAEIELKEDGVIGKSIECSEKHAPFIIAQLSAAGFQCCAPKVVIPGTQRISNWVQVLVSHHDFDEMHSAIANGLSNSNIATLEEDYSGNGERLVRINLSNISVFNK
ncbi:hypothetical protein [Dyella sp. GSA-30]|uniref:hypothetical protein n=1 Tax=Dyella sp. GSA-30 TaxID=2994496 RepID=UPI002491EF6B|nr:hypothetical protein [Dyella sp. GSA-30]BDU19969.1 hypothetical protein DYGSA30_14260 [Dyella sp. GSA-30]